MENELRNTAAVSLTNSVMRRVYFKMFLAMIVTAVTSVFVAGNEAILTLIFSSRVAPIVLLVLQVGVVLILSGRIQKLSTGTASLLFYLYSVLTGVTLSVILLVYTASSIAQTFFITAAVFAAMSIYGYFTSNDLSRMGSILFMALLGIIIATLVNFFIKSETMMWIITYAGVLIFVGLTAWDTQQIKAMAMAAPADSVGRLATIGALNLYLDFINLFLYLLRIFGNRD